MTVKLISLVFLFFLISLPAQSQTLIAPPYPSFVSCETGRAGCFLSKDSHEQVAAFYERDSGPATTKKNDPELNRYSYYEYMDVQTVHQYDPVGSAIGVRIYSQSVPADGGEPETSLPVVGEVFGKLKLLTMQGSMSMAKYNALVRKYRHLAAWFYPLEKGTAPSDPHIPKDKVILQIYDLFHPEVAAVDMASLMEIPTIAVMAEDDPGFDLMFYKAESVRSRIIIRYEPKP